MSGLASRIKHSESIQELECVGVALWAVTANCEKGKVVAKRMKCGASLTIAIQRLRKKETLSKSDTEKKCHISSVIKLLEKVSSLQNSSSSGNDNADNDHDTYRD